MVHLDRAPNRAGRNHARSDTGVPGARRTPRTPRLVRPRRTRPSLVLAGGRLVPSPRVWEHLHHQHRHRRRGLRGLLRLLRTGPAAGVLPGPRGVRRRRPTLQPVAGGTNLNFFVFGGTTLRIAVAGNAGTGRAPTSSSGSPRGRSTWSSRSGFLCRAIPRTPWATQSAPAGHLVEPPCARPREPAPHLVDVDGARRGLVGSPR